MITEVERSEEEARKILPQSVFNYYVAGAGDERTISNNIQAFHRIQFVPRFFRDTSKVDTSTTIKNIGKITFPALIAPMAMQKMAHEHGEKAVAKASNQVNIPYILSSFSTTSIETISNLNSNLLFQMYLYKRRDVSKNLLLRAKQAGYKVIVLTVDAVKFGRRERHNSSSLQLHSHLSFENFNHPNLHVHNGESKQTDGTSAIATVSKQLDDNIRVEDIQWIMKICGLPVWVKGILHPDDAIAAVEMGATGIVVSNHGGRQLEGCVPTMDALPSIVKAVSGKATIILDSGVRSGEDILRAMALGAHAVLLGRPILWALAEGGEDAVSRCLKRMKEEFELALVLCGVDCVRNISRDLVIYDHSRTSKL